MTAARVGIIGAGIAGPVLANFLKLKGYRPVVCERNPAPSKAGAVIAYVVLIKSGYMLLMRTLQTTGQRSSCAQRNPWPARLHPPLPPRRVPILFRHSGRQGCPRRVVSHQKVEGREQGRPWDICYRQERPAEEDGGIFREIGRRVQVEPQARETPAER